LSLIEAPAEAPVRIWAAPDLRLWPDSVRALGFDERPAGRELSWSTKLQLSLDHGTDDGPWPLSAICLLTGGESDAPSIEPLETAAAIIGFAQQFFRPHYIQPLGKLSTLLSQLGKVVAGTRIFRISRPASYDHLQTTIETVRQRVDAADGAGFERSIRSR